MNAVLAVELNECRAGVVFPEYRDDLRLGEARLAHMSFLFDLSAGETQGIKWPGLSGRRQLHEHRERGLPGSLPRSLL